MDVLEVVELDEVLTELVDVVTLLLLLLWIVPDVETRIRARLTGVITCIAAAQVNPRQNYQTSKLAPYTRQTIKLEHQTCPVMIDLVS